MMHAVRLPRFIVNQLLHHAQQNPDTEVCGLISSKEHFPIHCYPITNISSKPQRLFALDPVQQIAAMRTMREGNEELFAIYHSHPTSPPFPSNTDLAQANYPDVLYLIISLHTRGVLEMHGFFLQGLNVVEVPLEIVE